MTGYEILYYALMFEFVGWLFAGIGPIAGIIRTIANAFRRKP